jgi:SAM-dependent methyltransferase
MSSSIQSLGVQDTPNLAMRLRELTCGYWISQCIAAAARLGIADLLQSGSKSVAELATMTGTQARPLYRLLRALASFGIFAELREGHFSLTPMAELLASSPQSLRGWAILMGQEDWHRAWDALLDSLKTGEPAFKHVFGTSYWEYLSGNPEAAVIFNEGLTAYTAQVGEAVVGAYNFAPFRKMVDVGAGHGTLMAAILTATPHLDGIVFDLSHAAEGARRTLEAAGLTARCQVMTGDFFDAVPEGGDAYLLSHVIHDWSDERALAILRNCHRVMRPQSRLLLVEAVIPPGNEPFFGKLLDVHMLVATDQGTDRTEAEYRSLLDAAGFELLRVIPTASDVSIMESTPV